MGPRIEKACYRISVSVDLGNPIPFFDKRYTSLRTNYSKSPGRHNSKSPLSTSILIERYPITHPHTRTQIYALKIIVIGLARLVRLQPKQSPGAIGRPHRFLTWSIKSTKVCVWQQIFRPTSPEPSSQEPSIRKPLRSLVIKSPQYSGGTESFIAFHSLRAECRFCSLGAVLANRPLLCFTDVRRALATLPATPTGDGNYFQFVSSIRWMHTQYLCTYVSEII